MDDVCEVVVTGPDAKSLAELTHSLISSRLAACGQNISPIRSIYRWQGKISDEIEARVMLHTRTSLVPRIVDHVNKSHPYDVACIIALPLVGGNPAYLQWVRDETDGA